MGGRRGTITHSSQASRHRPQVAARCSRAGQSAMEFVMISAFVFLILFAILLVAYSQTSNFQQEVTASQIQKAGGQIVDAANTVYYAGPPAKKTITIHVPELISAVAVRNQSIIFTMQAGSGQAEYVVYAATNMTGTIRPFAGVHTITLEATDTVVNLTDG